MLQSKSFGEKSLEEKQQILQVNECFIINPNREISGSKKNRILYKYNRNTVIEAAF
jgi:hypothetical protein